MMMDFAGRLKRLRIEKGYSQATLAKKSPMQAKSRAKHPSPNTRAEFPIVKDTASDITTPRLYNIKSTPKLLISKIGACFHI